MTYEAARLRRKHDWGKLSERERGKFNHGMISTISFFILVPQKRRTRESSVSSESGSESDDWRNSKKKKRCRHSSDEYSSEETPRKKTRKHEDRKLEPSFGEQVMSPEDVVHRYKKVLKEFKRTRSLTKTCQAFGIYKNTIALTAVIADVIIAGGESRKYGELTPIAKKQTLADYAKVCKAFLDDSPPLQQKIDEMRKATELLTITYKSNIFGVLSDLPARIQIDLFFAKKIKPCRPAEVSISLFTSSNGKEKLPRQFGVRSGIPRAIVWAGAWTVTGHPGKTKDFQPPNLKFFCEKGGLTKTAPDRCRWDSTNKIQQIHLLAALRLDSDLDGNPPSHPSAPPPYNSATPSERREADFIRPQLRASSETARSEMPGLSQDSTTNTLSPIAHRLCNPIKTQPGTCLWLKHLNHKAQLCSFDHGLLRTSQPLHNICPNPMATDWQRIAGEFPNADLHCKHITWEDKSNVQRGKGRGHHKNWDKRPRGDVCFLCGKHGHWRRDCPGNTSSDAIDKSD
ncbi:coiled-coil domain-containing protein 106-like [Xyrichtys novacula]|uniref:Coiled-coil domain-containing protein 106-like n=1 Tax=Xyrichtys novacula TaxID=13765 RepID=A0AAV1HP40_XYRNO|nr:coiled-coil domain-containing protein 106-like [Xyrichtys novacula]